MQQARIVGQQVCQATTWHQSKAGGFKTSALPLGKAKEEKMRIVQVPSEKLKELVLSMGKLIRQGLGGASCFRLDSQSEHRSKPLASVSLPSHTKDPIRQVTRNGLPKGPVSELLGFAFPDKLGGSAPKLLGSAAVGLSKLGDSFLNSRQESAPQRVEIRSV